MTINWTKVPMRNKPEVECWLGKLPIPIEEEYYVVTEVTVSSNKSGKCFFVNFWNQKEVVTETAYKSESNKDCAIWAENWYEEKTRGLEEVEL